MKVKRSSRYQQRLPEEQRQITRRAGGCLLWTFLAGFGVLTMITGITSGKGFSPKAETLTVSGQGMLDARLTGSSAWHDVFVRAKTNWILFTGGTFSGNVYVTESRLLERPEELDHEQLTETAGLLQTFYQTSQIPMCVIAVPSAAEFYAADLLGGAPCPSQTADIEVFYQALPSPIRKIDVYHVLFTATDDYIYHRTDSRWTCYGAYCVYRNAIRKMGFAPISYDQFTVTHAGTFRGSLYDACLYDKVMPDILDIYTCDSGITIKEMHARLSDDTEESRSMYSLPEDAADPYDYYLGGACDVLYIETSLDSQKKLLLLKDSSADCMIPFLTQHYSELCVVDVKDTSRPLGELTDIADYNQVLVLCDADTFADSDYFSDLFSAVSANSSAEK